MALSREITSRAITVVSLTLTTMMSHLACTVRNPDFSSEMNQVAGDSLVSEGAAEAGNLMGGDISSGDSIAGEIPAGDSLAGESPAGQISAGEVAAGATSAGEVSAGENPAGQISAGEMPAGEVSAGQVSAGEEPAGEVTAGQISAGEEPAGDTPAGEQMPIDEDRDGVSPPDDCDDNNDQISPLVDEICDAKDNDCDGRVDEGTLNACGACGDLPVEVCDGEDNDCDDRVDEGTLNACGACGDLPVEVCDGEDNDCDDRVDEGTLNACGACGDLPVEVCDGEDNDCDDRVDEGTLNACGACGDLPVEVCDGEDNDCDDRVDEGTLNACGACGDLPVEVCDGEDNDCDGRIDERVLSACGTCPSEEVCDGEDNDCDQQVDEELIEPCFSLLHTIGAPNNIGSLGNTLHLVGDLNEDGIEDVVTIGQRGDRIRLLALSGDGSVLWGVNGDGDFGQAITSGNYTSSGQIIAASDPENSRLVFYNANGLTAGTLPVNQGAVASLATLNALGTEVLVMGIPDYRRFGSNRGLIRAARFNATGSLQNPTYIYRAEGGFNERWGDVIHRVDDLDGDGDDDIIFTRAVGFDRRTQLMSGATGASSSTSLLEGINDNSNESFADTFAVGQIYPNSRSFIFGAPLAEIGFNEVGAVYFLSETDVGFVFDPTLYGASDQAKLGSALAILPRPDRETDLLLIGQVGDQESGIIVFDAALDLVNPLSIPDSTLEVGTGLVISNDQQPDGTYRLWVSGVSNINGESRIWIYSAR